MEMSERDKRTLIIGGAVVAAILLYVFALEPFTAELARKREAIPRKQKELAEIRELREQYEGMQRQLVEAQAAASRRGPLLTEIENITKRANLGGKIVSLKPQTGTQAAGYTESLVEIRLDNITLYDVINYVYALEKATLRIKKLAFKPRFDNPKMLNATVLVASAG